MSFRASCGPTSGGSGTTRRGVRANEPEPLSRRTARRSPLIHTIPSPPWQRPTALAIENERSAVHFVTFSFTHLSLLFLVSCRRRSSGRFPTGTRSGRCPPRSWQRCGGSARRCPRRCQLGAAGRAGRAGAGQLLPAGTAGTAEGAGAGRGAGKRGEEEKAGGKTMGGGGQRGRGRGDERQIDLGRAASAASGDRALRRRGRIMRERIPYFRGLDPVSSALCTPAEASRELARRSALSSINPMAPKLLETHPAAPGTTRGAEISDFISSFFVAARSHLVQPLM